MNPLWPIAHGTLSFNYNIAFSMEIKCQLLYRSGLPFIQWHKSMEQQIACGNVERSTQKGILRERQWLPVMESAESGGT